jgi:hypothetical protein
MSVRCVISSIPILIATGIRTHSQQQNTRIGMSNEVASHSPWKVSKRNSLSEFPFSIQRFDSILRIIGHDPRTSSPTARRRHELGLGFAARILRRLRAARPGGFRPGDEGVGLP